MKKTVKKPKEKKTESELVHAYAKRTIKNQMFHGRVDTKKFKGLEYKTPSKNLWRDVDFYFSVVFQSAEQKYDFLKKSGWTADETSEIQIVNGLRLAEAMGIKLEKHKTKPYPTCDLDTKEFVLDDNEM